MRQAGIVVRELRKLLRSFPLVGLVLPFHLYLMFGGLGLIFLSQLLWETLPFSSFNTLDLLFNDIPLYALGYYGFFLGAWLTLVADDGRLLPYGLWGYAFVVLFPFDNLSVMEIVRAAIYVALGYFAFRLMASSDAASAKSAAEDTRS